MNLTNLEKDTIDLCTEVSEFMRAGSICRASSRKEVPVTWFRT